jgi:methylmalonyl-CoA mutase
MGNSKSFFEEFSPSSYKDWLEEAKKSLKGKDPESLASHLDEGITVKPLYTISDLEQIPEVSSEFPGLPRFLRSSNISGYRVQTWHIVQRIDTPEPSKANSFIHQEINSGISEFLLKHLDPQTTPRRGIAIETLKDFEKLLQNVNLRNINLHFETSHPLELLALFYAFLNRTGIEPQTISGRVHFDLLSHCLGNGYLPKFLSEIENFLVSMFNFFAETFPKFKFLLIDATTFYESGSNSVQEVAFTMNLAVEYLRLFNKLNIPLEKVIEKMFFKISIGSDIFLNLAKLRAIRLLWATILEAFEIETEQVDIQIYAVTNKRNKSKLDAYVNMLRNSCETITAILGSANYIEVTPYDYFLDELNEFSARNARNTQLVLLEEHNLTDTIDPAGGSWYLETLTFELARKSLELFKEVESKGGFIECIMNNFIQNSVLENQRKILSELTKRERILIGTNKYPNPSDDKFKIPEVEIDLNDSQTQSPSLKSIPFFAEPIDIRIFIKEASNENFSIFSFATQSSLKVETHSITPLTPMREAEPFEALRLRASTYQKKYEKLPVALLMPFGKVSDFKARVDFSHDFFAIGGFEVIESSPFETVEEAFQKILATLPQVVVFCSKNEFYPNFVPQLTALIKKAKPLIVTVLAGLPNNDEEINLYKNVGLDFFILSKSDTVGTLNKIFDSI